MRIRRHLPALLTGAIAGILLPFVGVALFLWTGPSADVRAERLLARHEAAWADRDHTLAALHRANPEFDLMWRTFTVLALCDRALAHPGEADARLALADELIADTVATVEREGPRHFLLAYVDHGTWVQPEAGSLFVDGELALMIAARRTVSDSPWLAALGADWTERVATDLRLAGDGLPESYPDEAWAFCITNSLLALHLHDRLDGTDHDELAAPLLARLRHDLVDPTTGLLGSDWRADGAPLDGTEGSSLWWVSTTLVLLDPELARVQYDGGRDLLVGGLPGLAWSREWPGSASSGDIDSGPIVPFFEASPAASGFALVASRAHDDRRTHRQLTRALRAADVLLWADPRLSQMSEAPMGDAIVALGLGFGPLFERARSGPTTPQG